MEYITIQQASEKWEIGIYLAALELKENDGIQVP